MSWLRKILCRWFKLFCPKPIEYISIWMCKKTNLIAKKGYCDSELRWFIKGIQPIKICEECDWINVWICTQTEKLATVYCPAEQKKFKAGSEPAEFCDIHKPPPPPPQPSKLDPALRYPNLGKIISPFFDPGLLVVKDEFLSDEDFEKFLEKVAKENLANYLRYFFGIFYEPDANRQVLMPFKIDEHGKFLIYQIDPRWFDKFCKRIEMHLVREIGVQIDIENGGFHWPGHYLNPANNYENTHEIQRWAIWHSYEYRFEPGEEGQRFANTYRHQEFFYDWLPRNLAYRFGNTPLLNLGVQEAEAGTNWHRDIILPNLKRHGFQKGVTHIMCYGPPAFAFCDFAQKIRDEGGLADYILSIHGIYTRQHYEYVRVLRPGDWEFKILPDRNKEDRRPLPSILSTDGREWWDHPEDTIENAKDLVNIVKQEGHIGLEINHSPGWKELPLSQAKFDLMRTVVEEFLR